MHPTPDGETYALVASLTTVKRLFFTLSIRPSVAISIHLWNAAAGKQIEARVRSFFPARTL